MGVRHKNMEFDKKKEGKESATAPMKKGGGEKKV
jgi:hypothetical protein